MGYPAYAGIDPMAKKVYLTKEGLPRIRGDRPAFTSHSSPVVMATPHTRGSTLLACERIAYHKGYPAYAGIDLERAPLDQPVIRLPRIRGDRPNRS